MPVLRGIRAVVRDRDWQTLVPVVRATKRVREAGRYSVLLDIDFDGFGCRYTGTLKISFSAQRLDVEFDGVAPVNFESNRIGLVVLHRPDDSGRSVVIGGSGGGETSSAFPVDISPHQPFQDIASLRWHRDGSDFRLDFTGDVFETEDQRNWTDASFKTYSRPLSLPFPMEIKAGNRLRQTITLTATYAVHDPSPVVHPGEELIVTTDVEAVVPALALPATTEAWSHGIAPAIPGLESLMVELVAGAPGLEAHAHHAVEQAKALNVPLDVRLCVQTPDQVPELLRLVPALGVTRLGVFNSTSHVTEPDLWEALKAAADGTGYTGALIAGARSHFTELNRNAHVLPADADALVYSITPQMHATEVPHMVDSLPIQRVTANNALRISNGCPLLIGPITLKPRFNAVATTTVGDGAPPEPPADPLQQDPFAAAWLLGSISALSLPGVAALSYFEAAGPRGISTPAGLTPAGNIFAGLASHRGRNVLKVRGARPGLVLYPVQVGDDLVLFAANLTQKPMNEKVQVPGGSTADLALKPWTAAVHHVQTEGIGETLIGCDPPHN